MIIRYIRLEPGLQRVLAGNWTIGRLREVGGAFDFYGNDENGRQSVQTYSSRAQFEASLQPRKYEPSMPEGYYGVVASRGNRAVCIRPDGSVAGSSAGISLDFQSAFGGLHKHDIGKRIFLRDGVFQMENTEQRDRRLRARVD